MQTCVHAPHLHVQLHIHHQHLKDAQYTLQMTCHVGALGVKHGCEYPGCRREPQEASLAGLEQHKSAILRCPASDWRIETVLDVAYGPAGGECLKTNARYVGTHFVAV